MNRMLVVVFNEASKAFEGRDALKSLNHDDDDILLHAYAIITKEADGSIVNEEDHRAAFSFPPGTSLRSLIDHLSKPKGVAIGTPGEPPVPGVDPDEARVVADFVSEVSQELTPGKFAVVAEIDEEWTPWVNLRMEELGGVVYRCPLFEVKNVVESEDIAAMKAHLAQLKAEHAQARAEHKAKLREKINQLDTRIQQQLHQTKKTA